MMRVTVLRFSDGTNYLILNIHHVVIDGWCFSFILSDLFEIYGRLCSGETAEMIGYDIEKQVSQVCSYADYIKWIETRSNEEGLKYWKELLSGYYDAAKFPSVFPARENEKSGYNNAEYNLSLSITKKLKNIALENHVTMNIVIETIFGLMLSAFTGNDDVVFGNVVSGRSAKLKGIDKVAGLFINTIPVRQTVLDKNELTFTDCCALCRSKVLRVALMIIAHLQRYSLPLMSEVDLSMLYLCLRIIT